MFSIKTGGVKPASPATMCVKQYRNSIRTVHTTHSETDKTVKPMSKIARSLGDYDQTARSDTGASYLTHVEVDNKSKPMSTIARSLGVYNHTTRPNLYDLRKSHLEAQQKSKPMSNMARSLGSYNRVDRSNTRALHTTHLEVEKKFRPLTNLHRVLAIYNHTARLKTIPQQALLIHDRYHDNNNVLFSNGIWVRSRCITPFITDASDGSYVSEVWQAKVKQAEGSATVTEMFELEGKSAVEEFLERRFGDIQINKMTTFAKSQTIRSMWTVSHQHSTVDSNTYKITNFKVQILHDEVSSISEDELAATPPFAHQVGELGITADVVTEEGGDAHAEAKLAAGKVLRARLDNLLWSHGNLFFSEDRGIGKLAAYDAWKKAQDAQK